MAFFITCFTHANAGQIYKWVDENGVTHFGTTRPAHADSSKMDLKKPHRAGVEQKQTRQATPKSHSSGNVRKTHTIESLAASRKKMDCKKTIYSANDHIDGKLAINQKNFHSGYINDATYRQSADALAKIKKAMSIQECDSASGPAQLFYQCVTSNVNRLTECSRKHQYGH